MSRNILDKSLPGWKQAIEYSEAELKEVERRAQQVRAAIGRFKVNLKRRALWPGTQDSETKSATRN